MIRNCLDLFKQGKFVEVDISRLGRKTVQTTMFDNSLSDDEKRARKAARDHAECGGKEFDFNASH